MNAQSRILLTGLMAGFFALSLPALPGLDGTGSGTEAQAAAKRKRDPGKRLYLRRTCIACHGRNGARAIQDYPNLAGQDAKYMITQVNDILSGKRTASNDAVGHPRTEGMRGALMTAEGKPRVTKDEIKKIVKWLAKLDPPKPVAPKTPVAPENIKKGAKLYKKKNCRACHGKDGKKPLKGYPFIAGQKRAYIVLQINDIKSKVRKNGKTKAMMPFVKKLSDEDIGLIADYLSQVDRSK
jgi:cytochrome c553